MLTALVAKSGGGGLTPTVKFDSNTLSFAFNAADLTDAVRVSKSGKDSGFVASPCTVRGPDGKVYRIKAGWVSVQEVA